MAISMAFDLGFQTKYVFDPLFMRFHAVKVQLKVFSILFKIHWACSDTIPTKSSKFKNLKFSENVNFVETNSVVSILDTIGLYR